MAEKYGYEKRVSACGDDSANGFFRWLYSHKIARYGCGEKQHELIILGFKFIKEIPW